MTIDKKKHVIITGGSSGIGKALACHLACQGYNVSIIAQDKSRLTNAAKEIRHFCQNKSHVVTLSADVSQELSINKAIVSAINLQGSPDILITSAGIAYPDYFDNLSTEIFEKSITINYLGSLYAIKTVFPYMKKNKFGHIVMISSGAGLMGLFGYSAYSPSKFAIRGLAESLRPEFKRLGIKISIAYPPDTDTPQFSQENLTKPQETKKILGPMKLWTADDIAKCIIRGINKNKFHITPGLTTRLLRFSHSFLFKPLNYYFDKIITPK
ncbi:retinol dehydrogenase [Legionella beliardensis]|uniref:3-dehydrosphinganine reductase n=1 Tax=Legionella beliardensis TaxID=91822 RepID=A0A378HZT0_9GAMM|nr:SDR family oxidoreductase [Legionella beliardensis]STX27970.1 retinol dehydrogenase [Legionella beliardensis]